jgi:hypothetical protein
MTSPTPSRLGADPVGIGGLRGPDQNSGLILLQSLLEYANQFIAPRENDLIKENLESLVVQGVVQV